MASYLLLACSKSIVGSLLGALALANAPNKLPQKCKSLATLVGDEFGQVKKNLHACKFVTRLLAPNLSKEKEAGENERLTQELLRDSPEDLLKIKGLTRLFLNQNKITEIPKELAQLEKLSAAGA